MRDGQATYQAFFRYLRVLILIGLIIGAGTAVYLSVRGQPDSTPPWRVAVHVVLIVLASAAILFGVMSVLGGLLTFWMSWLILGNRFSRGVELTRYYYRSSANGQAVLQQTKMIVLAFFVLHIPGYWWGFLWVLWAIVPLGVVICGVAIAVNTPPVAVFLTTSADASFHLFARLHDACTPVRIIALLRPDAAASERTVAVTFHDNWRTGADIDWRDLVKDLTSFVNAIIIDARTDTSFIQWEIEAIIGKDLLKRTVFIVDGGRNGGALNAIAASSPAATDILLQAATPEESLKVARSLILRRTPPSSSDDWIIAPIRLREFAP